MLGMTNQTPKQMTIKEYVAYSGLSDATIRRKIKTGSLPAERIEERWMVSVDTDDQSENGQSPRHGEPSEQTALVQQMRSENDYLRKQVDHLTQVVAMQTQQQGEMVKLLENPERVSEMERLRVKLQAWGLAR